MRRVLVPALGIVVVGCWVGLPRAAAENTVCTATWCSFLSPSRNISCELDYQRGSEIPDETFCQTNSPPQSVHMSTSGVFNTCTGTVLSGQCSPRHSDPCLRPNRRSRPLQLPVGSRRGYLRRHLRPGFHHFQRGNHTRRLTEGLVIASPG